MNVAILGHTNVGKTTLFRNLLQKEVGEIADRSNVTTEVLSLKDEKSGITFMDCPGFNEAGRILEISKLTNSFEHFEQALRERGLHEDLQAIHGIRRADIIYYVASSDRVHDKGYDSELELIKSYNPNIIGVLNKSNVARQSSTTFVRNTSWKAFFVNQKIDFIKYDFFYDQPVKLLDLLQKSVDTFDGKDKEIFKAYSQVLNTSFKEKCDRLADMIRNFRGNLDLISKTITIRTNQSEKEKTDLINRASNEIQSTIWKEMKNNISVIIDLFGFRGDLTMKSRNIAINETITETNRISRGVLFGAGGSVALPYFGVIGSLNVATAAGSVFVMPALGPLIIGGAIIGFIGSQFFTPTKTKELKFALTAQEIDSTLESLYAYLWIASTTGFANIIDFTESEKSEDVKDGIKQLMNNYRLSHSSGVSGYRDRVRSAIKDLAGI